MQVGFKRLPAFAPCEWQYGILATHSVLCGKLGSLPVFLFITDGIKLTLL